MTASMVLPTPGGPYVQHVGRIREVGACGEFPHEFLVDAGLGRRSRSLRAARPLGSSRTASGCSTVAFRWLRVLDSEQFFEELGMADASSAGCFEVGW